jgi:phosphoglycerate kinase
MENPLMHLPTLELLNASNKRILVRLDLNLPLYQGKITDLTRLQKSLPTIRELVAQNAKVIILTHLGRPKGIEKSLSLAPIADALREALAPTPVFFCETSQGPQVRDAIDALQGGQVLLIENIRFVEGEEKNDPVFIQELASWGDAYVNDAFSTAHRAHASTEGIAHFLPHYAGRLMEAEIKALTLALETPRRPLMAIVGGSKISTKLPLLENLISKVDLLVIGGGMANTLLAAKGVNIGGSLYEPDLLKAAQSLLKNAPAILLPEDVVVAQDLNNPLSYDVRALTEIQANEKIFDLGPCTCTLILEKMAKCHTLLWNGPLGVFEVPPFDQATNQVAQGAARLTRDGSLTSIAGGGDTLAALSHAGALQDFTYVSTAGGAFLEWIEGKTLPGIAALLQPFD